jgi:amidase
MSFAVKDVLDVEGITTGSGNPDWQRTHLPARSTAPAVARWLASGGRMVGKTICDELAFSLEGANFHYGTPRNPRCPGRLPGGSSSGSAAAVAGGLVDGGLGSDTGGSVRVPASFCGIFGFRPTHGRVPVRGMTPLAPTYDTVGWFARDGRTLQRFGRALSMGRRARPPRQLLLVADAWELVEPRSAAPLRDAADALGIRGEVRIYDGDPTAWYEAYRVLQGAQIWSQHHEWIERVHPRFGPRTAERFAASSRITRAEVAEQARFRRRSLAARAAFYPRALALNSAAGHSGLPEVVLPLAVAEGCPIGLGVIAAAYRDESLLALAASDRTARLARSCRSSSPGPDR